MGWRVLASGFKYTDSDTPLKRSEERNINVTENLGRDAAGACVAQTVVYHPLAWRLQIYEWEWRVPHYLRGTLAANEYLY
jgi:hypothetical protein